MNKQKVTVAFSGGLDTSYAVVWLKERGFEIVTCTVDTGGFSVSQLATIKNKSQELGATKHYEIPALDEYLEQYVSYLIKAQYLRGGTYPLITSAPRYIEILKIIEIARQEKATAIAHGCTGAGNDQVRYDSSIAIFAPELEIIAPYRDQELTRQKEADYLKQKGFEVTQATTDYSINISLLGTTICGKELNNSGEPLPDSVYPTVKPVEFTPNKAEQLSIDFEAGLPVGINSSSLPMAELFTVLNAMGSKHGFGKGVHLGETILGIKGRVGFEAPAFLLVLQAHKELAKLVLSKKQLFWLQTLGTVYGDMVHESEYFDPLARDLESFLDSANQKITGTVELKLFKGNCQVQGLQSPYSIMDAKVATYAEGNPAWSGSDAKGFCKLYGMGMKLAKKVSGTSK